VSPTLRVIVGAIIVEISISFVFGTWLGDVNLPFQTTPFRKSD
jgi:hypothetical protein